MEGEQPVKKQRTEYSPSFKKTPFHHEDRQWDARVNVQLDGDLQQLLRAIETHWDSGALRYVLVGGVEIGTRPTQDDYQVKHVHIAAIFHNRISKRSILNHWAIKQGNGYYLEPRNRDLSYTGWRDHHIKTFSKVDESQLLLFEKGTLPQEQGNKSFYQRRSELEKKSSVDQVIISIRQLIEEGKDKEAFEKYPRNYLMYGEKIKALVTQKRDFFQTNGNPHIWVYGYPGTGKTAILQYVYPNTFKKNLFNKFFDLYDPQEHTHVMLEDLDHEAVGRLSINFIKTICDEGGFAVDQKYKTPQLARTTVLVTSNFTIDNILEQQENTVGLEQNKLVIKRRFWHVNVYELLRLLGLKLLPKSERDWLKKTGNGDVSKLFIDYDYLSDTPTGIPIKSPEEYQEMIKNHFYN